MKALLSLLALLPLSAFATDPAPVVLQIKAPARVSVGKPFTVTFEVTNTSTSGLYFIEPWWWASNGLFLTATARNGSTHETAPHLYDIARENVCGYVKRLPPGGTLRFKETLNESGFGNPSLALDTPGEYQLTWVYDITHYELQVPCPTRGWAVFSGTLQSDPAPFLVTP